MRLGEVIPSLYILTVGQRELIDPVEHKWAHFRVASFKKGWWEPVEYIHELNPEVAMKENASKVPT